VAPVHPLWRRAGAECLGTGLLVAIVVGSGIAAQQLSPGDVGLQLLENAAATSAGLAVLILMLGPISGAHLNPAVSGLDWLLGSRRGTGLSARELGAYVPAQVAGAVGGAVLANLMYARAAVTWSARRRSAGHLLLGEVVATAGLLVLVVALARTGRAKAAPAAVGAYIGAAYFFTSSTSFANPAVTVGRAFTDTFAGIAPASVPGFVGAQFVGTAVAVGMISLLYPDTASAADDLVVPHGGSLPAEGQAVQNRPQILVACRRNAGRSIAASVLLDHYAQGRIAVSSAGSTPADEIHPEIRTVLAERGLSTEGQFPKPFTDEMVQASDVVITMGCGEACPVFPGRRYLDWAIDDPHGRALDAVRRIVDDLDFRVRALVLELLPGRELPPAPGRGSAAG
jgi:arsenate reductase